jgi:hypothetical protein
LGRLRLEQEIHSIAQAISGIIGQVELASSVISEEQYDIADRVKYIAELIDNIVDNRAGIESRNVLCELKAEFFEGCVASYGDGVNVVNSIKESPACLDKVTLKCLVPHFRCVAVPFFNQSTLTESHFIGFKCTRAIHSTSHERNHPVEREYLNVTRLFCEVLIADSLL